MAVIGDGAITGGMAYEAMNHAGFLDKNMIVVLNDNQQVSTFTCPLFCAFCPGDSLVHKDSNVVLLVACIDLGLFWAGVIADSIQWEEPGSSGSTIRRPGPSAGQSAPT